MKRDPVEIIKDLGVLTGKEFVRETGMDTFSAWKYCARSDQIRTSIVGKRYLRLDIKVEGYARLSPSIMREYLNYTVIGLENDDQEIARCAAEIESEIAAISKRKITLAYDTVQRLIESHSRHEEIINGACFIIAGDVVFGMAHAELRPESSTGELVRGSDLDIIMISDGLPDQILITMDEAIYKEKYNLLMNPVLKEELDYIIKDLETVEEQLKFKDFKAMVASKILAEGRYLYGSFDIFSRAKEMLVAYKIYEKLEQLEEKARMNRSGAEQSLLKSSGSDNLDELMALFFTTEEKEEIF